MDRAVFFFFSPFFLYLSAGSLVCDSRRWLVIFSGRTFCASSKWAPATSATRVSRTSDFAANSANFQLVTHRSTASEGSPRCRSSSSCRSTCASSNQRTLSTFFRVMFYVNCCLILFYIARAFSVMTGDVIFNIANEFRQATEKTYTWEQWRISAAYIHFFRQIFAQSTN